MIRCLATLLLWFPLLVHGQSAADEIIPVKQIIPDIVADVRYAGNNNFCHQKLYTVGEPYLALGAALRLKTVQDSLRKITVYDGVTYPQGLGLKIYDGYRPRAVQFLMWEILPNPIYVADPTSGSVHNRGGAVDISIVNYATRQEIPMPTEFDFFGAEAGHSYNNLPANIIANRTLLKNMMTQVGGFSLYDAEWWHYTYPAGSSYPLLDFQMK